MSLESKIQEIGQKPLPAHVAVIMDGNGRWAKTRGLDRSMGHVEGVNAVRRITEIASDLGVKYLTLYTFSTENWNRPQMEVDALMHLVVTSIEKETPELIEKNVRLTTIGDMERVPEFARTRLQKCMADTAHCTGMELCLALSYSSRWEIVEAVRGIANEVAEGKLKPADIDDAVLSAHMLTAHMPDPDLLIRTAGDLRISNYLLWQIAYSELYFTPVLWPDFSKEDFLEAIIDFQSRERRFGKTSEQVINDNEQN